MEKGTTTVDLEPLFPLRSIISDILHRIAPPPFIPSRTSFARILVKWSSTGSHLPSRRAATRGARAAHSNKQLRGASRCTAAGERASHLPSSISGDTSVCWSDLSQHGQNSTHLSFRQPPVQIHQHIPSGTPASPMTTGERVLVPLLPSGVEDTARGGTARGGQEFFVQQRRKHGHVNRKSFRRRFGGLQEA